jgi:hypothetical protein
MGARSIALCLAISLCSATVHADSGADRPVFITVVGHGSIRLRLSVGSTAPCDSADDRMLFDGWIGPGRYVWSTGADAVCFQHTFGALRQSNWSEPQVVGTTVRKARWLPPRPTEIQVSTD